MFLLFFKRIGILLGILILLGSFAFSPNQVLAQTAGTPCTTENGASGYWRYVAGTLRCDDSLIGNVVGSQTSKAAKTIDDSSWAVTVLKSGMTSLANIILQMVGSLLTIAGVLLNGAVEISVQKMSGFINQTPAITTAWTVIRDVSNIIILFILLFSAIGTILRTDQLVPKSSLAKIIIAALLINFSMFFTKVIIDVSSVTTLAIYNEIASTDQNQSADPKEAELYGISGAFMQHLELQTSYKKILAESKNPNFETHIFQQMIFGIIIILIATFVLLVTAIMLIVRFGVLIMLLITSPIGLVGGLIPKMAKYKDQWWSTLLGQAFFAPVLLLFLLISISIIKSINESSALHTNLGAETGVGSVFNFFGGGIAMAIQYCLTIFFLVFSLTIAKSIAGSAGAGATKWASQKAGSLAFGMPKYLGGVAAQRVISPVAGSIGKKYDNLLTNISPEKYRKLNAITLGVSSAVDRGFREKIKGVEVAKLGTGSSLAEKDKAVRERVRDLGGIRERNVQQANLDAGERAVETIFNNATAASFDSTTPIIKDYLESIKNLTNEQLEKLMENNLDLLKKEHFALGLTQKQIDFIKDSKLVNEGDKKSIQDTREKGMLKRIDLAVNAFAEAQKIASGKPADIAALPKPVLKRTEIAVALNINTLKEIQNNDKLDTTERAAVKTEIESRHSSLTAKAASAAGLTPEETKELARLEKNKQWLNHADQLITW